MRLKQSVVSGLFGGAFILLLIISGCSTPSVRPSATTQKSASTSSAPQSQAAAQKAFDEMNAPGGTTSGSSGSAVKNENPAPKNQDPPLVQTSGNQQDWIDGVSRKYPSTSYLTAVGFAPQRRQAEDNARAEISKIFVSHVQASTKIEQEYLQTLSDKQENSSGQVKVEDMVTVSTEKVLAGVRIAEVYKDSAPGTDFYALAVMDRKQTMTALKNKIIHLDKEINTLLNQAQQEKKELLKIKTLAAAMEKHLLRQAREAELTVVDPSGRGMDAPIEFEDIKRPLTDILSKKFRLYVTVSGDRSVEIQKALSEGLTRQGFVLTNQLQNAQVAVKGKVEIKPLDRPDQKWKYMRWQTTFDLVDLSNETIFGSFNNSGREGHLSLEQASLRCVKRIEEELLPIVSKDVYSYVFGKSRISTTP